MKTLYCIIGNLRAGDWPVESFTEHLKDDEMDVALYVGDTYPESKWRDIAKYIWEVDETINWWETEYDNYIDDWRDWKLKGNIFGPSGGGGSGMIIVAFRQMLLRKLKKIEKYERYVLARADQVFTHNELPDVKSNSVFIPDAKNYRWGGVTDRFMVADYRSFLKSLDVLPTLKKLGDGNYPDNVEQLLEIHYTELGLDICDISRFMYCVGRDNEQTRWRKPKMRKPAQRQGYFLKYVSEYKDAIARKEKLNK